MTSRRRSLALVFGSLFLVLALGTIITLMVVENRLVDGVDDDLNASLAQTAGIISAIDLDSVSLDPTSRSEALITLTPDGEVTSFLPAGPVQSPLGAPNVDPMRIVDHVGSKFTVPGLDGAPDYRIGSTSVDLGDTQFILAMARPLDDVDNALGAIFVTLLATTAGVLVLLGVIFWLVLRAGLKPVEEIVNTAQTIAAGDYSRRADITGTPEVERLGGSINAMLDQIQSSFAERDATEQRLKRFVSDASHELRTPLTTVQGYSELYLSGTATDAASVTKQMSRIHGEAKRMSGLVEDLLTLARLDQGRGLEHGPVDLTSVLVDTVADAQMLEPDRSIGLRGLPASPIRVMGDEDKLRQVFGNLLANVRVHTPAEAPVDVLVSVENGAVFVSVADTGPGMEHDQVERVFDRFYRTEESRHRSKGGSGLGLSIVKSIVEAHGGEVAAASTSGEGATMTVQLPTA